MSEWISVDKYLPEDEEYYLVRSESQHWIAYYNSNYKEWKENGCCGCFHGDIITHWMSLPPEPKD